MLSHANTSTIGAVHGDTMATVSGLGSLIGTFTYDPFGKTTSSTTPDNANGKADFDYLDKYENEWKSYQ